MVSEKTMIYNPKMFTFVIVNILTVNNRNMFTVEVIYISFFQPCYYMAMPIINWIHVFLLVIILAPDRLAQPWSGLARRHFLQHTSKSESFHFERLVTPSAGAGVGRRKDSQFVYQSTVQFTTFGCF
jgi:hypothetical protein